MEYIAYKCFLPESARQTTQMIDAKITDCGMSRVRAPAKVKHDKHSSSEAWFRCRKKMLLWRSVMKGSALPSHRLVVPSKKHAHHLTTVATIWSRRYVLYLASNGS